MKAFMKAAVLLLALVLSVCVFTACDSGSGSEGETTLSIFEQNIDAQVEREVVELAEANKLGYTGTLTEINNPFACFVDVDTEEEKFVKTTTTVINYVSNEVLFTKEIVLDFESDEEETEEDEKKILVSATVSLGDKVFLVTYAYSNEDVEHVLFDLEGNEIVTVDNITDLSFNEEQTILTTPRKLFVIDEGKVVYSCDTDLRGDKLPTYDKKLEEGYLDVSSNLIKVYDKDYKLVKYYEIEGYDEVRMFVLSNNTVLVQAYNLLDEDASTYDVREEGNKYDVITYIYNPADGTKTDIELGFIVEGVMDPDTEINRYSYEFKIFKEGIINGTRNVLKVYPIVNKRVSDHADFLLTDEKIATVMNLNDIIPGFASGTIYPVADGRVIVTDVDGMTYLLDKAGNVLATVSGVVGMTADYLYTKNCIYDYNATLVYDFDADGYTLVSAADGYAVLAVTKAGFELGGKAIDLYAAYDELVIYNVGEKSAKTIIDSDNEDPAYTVYAIGDTYYITRDTISKEYSLRNMKGENIIKSENLMTVIADKENSMLIVHTTDEEGENIYYTVK